MSTSQRFSRQNSGNSSFTRTQKPFNDRKRSANLENALIAAGVANLKVDEDTNSMISPRVATGNLDASLDEYTPQI